MGEGEEATEGAVLSARKQTPSSAERCNISYQHIKKVYKAFYILRNWTIVLCMLQIYIYKESCTKCTQ